MISKNTYYSTYTISKQDVGNKNTLKLSSLFRILQDSAGEHSELLGTGNAFTQKEGLMWIIIRSSADIIRMPSANETVSIETWPGPSRHMLFPRSYIIRDSEKNTLVTAVSVWALANVNTRSIIHSEYAETILASQDLRSALSLPAKIRIPILNKAGTFTVPEDYLDTNLHMNNTHYFDLAEKFAPDISEARISSVAIEYVNEAKLGEHISVYSSAVEDVYYLSGETEKQCFKIKYFLK